MNECWNQFLIQLKYPSEFWLGFFLFREKCLLKTERGESREYGNAIFPFALPPGGGGDSHMKQTGMLVGNFEFNP